MKESVRGIPGLILLFMMFLSFYAHSTAVSASQTSKTVLSYGTIRTRALMGGWGGVRLYESTYGDPGNPASIVFPGEQASNAEMVMQLMKERGYNTVRVMFESPVLENPERWEWNWNDGWFQKTLIIAEKLDMWIIIDYHAYEDLRDRPDEWVAWWRDNIISKYKDAYDKMIWEPINEPVVWEEGMPAETALEILRSAYQEWINMCRNLGDTHWIVMSCGLWWLPIPEVDWWATVIDPLNKVFLGKHFYYMYEWNQDAWTIADAEAKAEYYYHDVLVPAIEKYGRPFLCTEMGADCGVVLPPDVIFPGSAQYTPVTLAFVQRLISHFDTHPNRIEYILWPGGDWSNAGLYGAMNVWGNLLEYEPFHPI